MRKHLSSIVLILIFFIGLSVILYPTVSNYWNTKTQSKAIVDYEAMLAKLTPEDYTAYFSAAEKYNAKLRTISFPLMNYEQIDGYQDLLNVSGNGIIGYITIEKIDLKLPIYHGTSTAVLNVAVGHLEGTSLPIGGESTHSVLSAHRALPSAKLFTDLDKLEIGDTFTLNVLDRLLTYEVDQIRIVKPDEVDDLYVVEGEDYCTLQTCTPKTINTHRLLVRGHRVENAEESPTVLITADAIKVDSLVITPVVAAPMLLILLIVLLVKYRKKKQNADRKERRDEIRE